MLTHSPLGIGTDVSLGRPTWHDSRLIAVWGFNQGPSKLQRAVWTKSHEQEGPTARNGRHPSRTRYVTSRCCDGNGIEAIETVAGPLARTVKGCITFMKALSGVEVCCEEIFIACSATDMIAMAVGPEGH